MSAVEEASRMDESVDILRKRRILESKAKYREKNREKLREKGRAYARSRRAADPDAARAYANEYRKQNPELEREKNKRYYERHKAKVLAKGRKYKAENRERVDEAKRKWLLDRPWFLSEYRKKNREKLRQRSAEFARNNPQYAKQYVRDNHDEVRARKKRWKQNNRDIVLEYGARRRAVKQSGTPVWANRFFMTEAYALARLRSALFGFKWHVDHIVPIKSPLVCGLHVENNLSVIPSRINAAKGNRFWPDMP